MTGGVRNAEPQRNWRSDTGDSSWKRANSRAIVTQVKGGRAEEKPSKISPEKFSRLELGPFLRERKRSSDHIADALRAAIYDGQFPDGEELNQVELARYFKVSRIPIREALKQLEAEGLVTSQAHRRTIVAGLELDKLVELVEMRAVLEGFLVEKAGPSLRTATFRRLNRLCDEMDRLNQYDHEWVKRNWEFHRSLYTPSNRAAAITLTEQLHLKVERYIRRAGRAERRREAAAEHRQILEALEKKDCAAAGWQMREHILHTAEDIRKHLDLSKPLLA